MNNSSIFLLVFGSLVAFVGLGIATQGKDSHGNSQATLAFLVIAIGALFGAGSFYIDGQLDKTLPSLKSHQCTEAINLSYHLGESDAGDLAKLIRANHNAHCVGSITIHYPGNPPKVIALTANEGH